jgi:hypothetical protein
MFAQCVEMKTPPTTKLQQMATETETNRKLHFRWRIVNQVNVKMSSHVCREFLRNILHHDVVETFL